MKLKTLQWVGGSQKYWRIIYEVCRTQLKDAGMLMKTVIDKLVGDGVRRTHVYIFNVFSTMYRARADEFYTVQPLK